MNEINNKTRDDLCFGESEQQQPTVHQTALDSSSHSLQHKNKKNIALYFTNSCGNTVHFKVLQINPVIPSMIIHDLQFKVSMSPRRSLHHLVHFIINFYVKVLDSIAHFCDKQFGLDFSPFLGC